MNALININVSMFTRIIRDPALSTEEYVFNESLLIVFPNNVLVSQFHSSAAHHSTEERGGASRAH